MKIKVLLIAILFIAFHSVIFSAEVGLKTARLIASKAYFEKAMNFSKGLNFNDVSIQDIFTKRAGTTDFYYVFTFTKGGFVIVSAEDVLPPVLGYSIDGTYSNQDQPDSYRNFMQTYCDEVNFIRENNVNQLENIRHLWDYYVNLQPELLFKGTTSKSVDPLLTCLWNQGGTYNLYCPADPAGPGGHVYAGCVATAMAQVMYYWRYPLQGTGSHTYYYPPYGSISADFGSTTYEWEGMQNSINHDYPDPIALFQFHCGVAVDMMYGPGGSGAYSNDVPPALVNYFGYSSDCYFSWKQDHSNTEWADMLKVNLDNSWPMYYSGFSSAGGHAFVCDGYQDDYFHFNFGWSGTSNGYYTLLSVNGFNSGQGAVFDTYPGSNYPYNWTGSHTLTIKSGSIEDGSGPTEDYQDNVNCSWLISPQTAEDSISNIVFKFVKFDTDVDDFVTIYDGSTTQDNILGQFSGNQIPGQVTSTSNQMLIVFTTNGSGTAKGWLGEFTAYTPDFCKGVVTMEEPQGSFSDGSSNFNYQNNTVCMWQIEPLDGQPVTLSFTSFNTESNSDKVRIYDLETQELLAEYSGTYSPSDLPEPVTSPSGKMFVAFSTNSSVTKQGWNATYSSGLTGIENNLNVSDNYRIFPNPATDKLIVEFKSEQDSPVEFKLMNLTGQTIFTRSLTSAERNSQQEINLDHIRPGVYLVHLTGLSESYTQRIIVK